MFKKLFLVFSILLLCPLFADQEGIDKIEVGDHLFVVTTPENWMKAEPREPFDSTFIHKDGSRKCLLLFSCSPQPVEEEILSDKMEAALEALYGQEFSEDPRYLHGALTYSDRGFMQWFFCWDKGNGSMESVFVYASSEFSDPSCFRCMIFINEVDQATLAIDKAYEQLYKFVGEDFPLFFSAIDFFPKADF